MPSSSTTPDRQARSLVDRLRRLFAGDCSEPGAPKVPADDTRELLVPMTDERASRRARRQARAYLEHRRAKLAEQLQDRSGVS